MTGHGEKLSRRMDAAILALVSQPTIEQAGATAGVSPRTIRRWMQLPHFKQAHREARRRAFDDGIAGLQQLTGKAVTTLEEVMDGASASARVAAARTVLEMGFRIEEREANLRLPVDPAGQSGDPPFLSALLKMTVEKAARYDIPLPEDMQAIISHAGSGRDPEQPAQ